VPTNPPPRTRRAFFFIKKPARENPAQTKFKRDVLLPRLTAFVRKRLAVSALEAVDDGAANTVA
jgi:hypothetical protein